MKRKSWGTGLLAPAFGMLLVTSGATIRREEPVFWPWRGWRWGGKYAAEDRMSWGLGQVFGMQQAARGTPAGKPVLRPGHTSWKDDATKWDDYGESSLQNRIPIFYLILR